MSPRKLVLLAGAPLAAGLALVVGASVFAATTAGDTEPVALELDGSACFAGADTPVTGLDTVQARNAAVIVQTGAELGVPARGQVVAVATALQEAGLRNLASRANPGSLSFPHDGVAAGDHDSVGLFQQRDAWGPMAARMDPTASARMFYTGGQAGQRGLLDIAGWEAMPIWQAAQAVQVSAFPTAYAKHETLAVATVAALGGGVTCAPTTACPETGLPAERGLTPDALNVLRCAVGTFGITNVGGVGERLNNPTSDHPSGRAVDVMIADWSTPTGRARGWEVAEWMRAHATELGITYVIFGKRIWRAGTDEWRPYQHRAGSNPTLDHLDHVHVSVHGTSGTMLTGSAA